jgi:hypothetical protein
MNAAPNDHHSARNAVTGSMRVARYAGIWAASSATAMSTTPPRTNVSVSVDLISNRNVPSHRARISASARPMPSPIVELHVFKTRRRRPPRHVCHQAGAWIAKWHVGRRADRLHARHLLRALDHPIEKCTMRSGSA